MSQFDHMDDFVDWDKAGAAIGDGQLHQLPPYPELDADGNPQNAIPNGQDIDNLDLVFANVGEDDFTFHALQHFTANMDAPDNIDLALQEEIPAQSISDFPALQWETPAVPCAQCSLGGYACKRIREGRYEGFCTSCVALQIDCSFAGVTPATLDPASTTLPVQSWPALKDYPTAEAADEHTLHPLQPLSSASAMELFTINNCTGAEPDATSKQGPAPPKVGARLSRESVRILKNWLSTHYRHPYPSDEEKDMLQRQTGLNKTQITNWLANARRRGKVQPPRSTSPQVGNWAGSMDIPKRRGTPALESMNPLQRWQHSPPENEPASVSAIARAVTVSSGMSSGLNSPFSQNYTDDGSGKSLCNQSSISSFGTSGSSNGSRGSAYSHGSRNSFGSFGSAPFTNKNRRRRRRRAAPRQSPDGKTSLAIPLKTFQCTFCTETFRTKHDWGRHEKSLHLSLERWVCAPDGPRVRHPGTGHMSCVFCGEANPSDAHIEGHNHSACLERTLEERTFYRKDHLNQHLRLVHNVKFADWSMKSWQVSTPEIRSRCGFCGIVLDTWTHRVDHLAEHFKTGYSMADWKGDWGFDNPVLDMVENSIPPYLIHNERLSPLPFVAGGTSPETPRNAYELIKMEMAYFGVNFQEENHRAPTDEEMMIEACRIIFASELLSLQGIATQQSWLRDIIMSDERLAQKARFGPLRSCAESRLATLKINGKDNLFEQCPMEQQLHEFVKSRQLLGLTAMDNELQDEACKIVGRIEEVSTNPSEGVANWLVRAAKSSTAWLVDFRRRAQLPRSEDVRHDVIRSTDPTSIDSTIHNYSRLECELADFLKLQRSVGYEPTNDDLQRQARIIIYELDDEWNQTAADNLKWLEGFKSRHPVDGASPHDSCVTAGFPSLPTTMSGSPIGTWSLNDSSVTESTSRQATNPALESPGFFNRNLFMNEYNCYRQLARELGRYVASTMSANNPNQHVPSDAELQHQARWIIYDSDDTWNQTAADNAEWLRCFKINTGIAKMSEDAAAGEHMGPNFAPLYSQPQALLDVLSGNRCANSLWAPDDLSRTNSGNNIVSSGVTNMPGRQESSKAPMMGSVPPLAGGVGSGDAALEEMDFDFGVEGGFNGVALRSVEEEVTGRGGRRRYGF